MNPKNPMFATTFLLTINQLALMTLYSLALRINEIIELHKEYDQTRNPQLLMREKDMRVDLDILVKSIISTYQVTIREDPKDQYVDVDQYGS